LRSICRYIYVHHKGEGATLDFEDGRRKRIVSARLNTALPLVSAQEYVIDPGSRIVHVKFTKKLTIADIERYANRVRSNPQFRPDYAEIVDLTQVEEVELGAEDFLMLADEIDPFTPEAKRAFVVRGAVQSHAARMHKALRPKRTIEIFHSVEEAERWIKA
jgi:hypothetical protein